MGDFNGDGKLDLAVVNNGSSTVSILLGDGTGNFTLASSPATGSSPVSVAVGDFNGDGKLDLAVANEGSNTVSILLGDGTGNFTLAASPATGLAPVSVAVGDFNGDGRLDLAVGNSGEHSFHPAAKHHRHRLALDRPQLWDAGGWHRECSSDADPHQHRQRHLTLSTARGQRRFYPDGHLRQLVDCWGKLHH